LKYRRYWSQEAHAFSLALSFLFNIFIVLTLIYDCFLSFYFTAAHGGWWWREEHNWKKWVTGKKGHPQDPARLPTIRETGTRDASRY